MNPLLLAAFLAQSPIPDGGCSATEATLCGQFEAAYQADRDHIAHGLPMLPGIRERADELAACRGQAVIARRKCDERVAGERAAAAQFEGQAVQEQLEHQTKAAAAANRGLGWSTVACYAPQLRREAKEEIAKERQYAREGGDVVDLDKLHDLQDQMRSADEWSAKARAGLRQLHSKALDCRAPAIATVIDCVASVLQQNVNPENVEPCNAPTTRAALEEIVGEP